MKILVAIKQVPERDAATKIAPAGKSLDFAGAKWVMNEPDAYALEEALQLRDRTAADGKAAEVIVLTAGPERANTMLREALARGADRALHILTLAEGEGERDSLAEAGILAEAIRAESPDLVLTGVQSDDLGAGATGPILAELLGLPHTTLVVSVERNTQGSIQVKKELEGGWFQHVTLPLPALLTIQSGGNPLRYATLLGIKKARSKPVAEVEATPAEPRSNPRAEVVKVSPPERTRRTVRLTGTPTEIAAQLIERLKFEARIL